MFSFKKKLLANFVLKWNEIYIIFPKYIILDSKQKTTLQNQNYINSFTYNFQKKKNIDSKAAKIAISLKCIKAPEFFKKTIPKWIVNFKNFSKIY